MRTEMRWVCKVTIAPPLFCLTFANSMLFVDLLLIVKSRVVIIFCMLFFDTLRKSNNVYSDNPKGKGL